MDNIPIVYTVHNNAFKEYPNDKLRRVRRLLFKPKNIAPVTISDQSADSFEEAYTNINHTLIYNGRNYPKQSEDYSSVINEVRKYQANEQTKVFVNIGRIAPQKNQLMLVEAFTQFVEKEHANAVLLIIGGGINNAKKRSIYQKLKQLERKHSYIHILGEHTNATDYLHVSDFFCLSSLWEGMPYALI